MKQLQGIIDSSYPLALSLTNRSPNEHEALSVITHAAWLASNHLRVHKQLRLQHGSLCTSAVLTRRFFKVIAVQHNCMPLAGDNEGLYQNPLWGLAVGSRKSGT